MAHSKRNRERKNKGYIQKCNDALYIAVCERDILIIRSLLDTYVTRSHIITLETINKCIEWCGDDERYESINFILNSYKFEMLDSGKY